VKWLTLIVASLFAAAIEAQPTVARLSTAGASDLSAGQRIFDSQCAWCHGAGGTGGTGPDLRRSSLGHATTDDALVNIVRNGIPGTEMPGFAIALTERMAWQTAAYVKSLGRTKPLSLPGNAQRGAKVYDSSGCASCHTVNGVGGISGPELTSIGALRGAPYLRESIVRPAAAHPSGYLVVRATTKSGEDIRGVRVNEDVFWIHVRDAGGNLHALEKSQLAKVERQLDASLMPSYESRLQPADLDDLVAYLTTLRGAQ
jgi:cytochrome c oxidase cbb3-type subunit 3